MDQPTHIEITIKGTKENVKRAALSAQRRMDRDTRGFKEKDYVLGSGSSLEKMIEKAIDDTEENQAVLNMEDESYSCIWEEDITDIAKEIIKTAPEVEFQISAVITITYAEGYDLCVDISYVDGEMNEDTYEAYYEGWEDEEDWDEDWIEDEE